MEAIGEEREGREEERNRRGDGEARGEEGERRGEGEEARGEEEEARKESPNWPALASALSAGDGCDRSAFQEFVDRNITLKVFSV